VGIRLRQGGRGGTILEPLQNDLSGGTSLACRVRAKRKPSVNRGASAGVSNFVHHPAHTIDLFQYQCGEDISQCDAVAGPVHPTLKIALDMAIIAKTPSGCILCLSLSFNNEGPIGSFFRYICDHGTFNAYYDDLADGHGANIDVTNVDTPPAGDCRSTATRAEGNNLPRCP
jgi:Bacterial oxidoreductases, C-terminal